MTDLKTNRDLRDHQSSGAIAVCGVAGLRENRNGVTGTGFEFWL
jgi:hypothetical protein